MGTTKREFKWFTVPQYRQEEEYLSSMHRKGWKLTKITFPGIYYFEQCEPLKVSYRLDYNQEGAAHKEEYVRMFADCGWEYLFDFVGYSYFRKEAEQSETDDEIFCDDESRLDMMRRVFKGRVTPMIWIFAGIIIPQYLMHTVGNGGGSHVQSFISVLFLILGLLYILLFGVFAVEFYRYEKSIHPEEKYGVKYGFVFAGLAFLAILMIGVACKIFISDYLLVDSETGFVIDADNLNKSVVREYELKPGDQVCISHEFEGGELYISIGKEDEEPVFYGNSYSEFDDFCVNIQEEGLYRIQCEGKRASGKLTVEVK